MGLTGADPEHDLFISYSTRSDYRLARSLESFLESFHRTRTGKSAQLKVLDACLDGSDFVVPVTESDRESVPEVIERHLSRCRHLLVLCSTESMQSTWVRDEIRLFRERYGSGRIVLAITEGTQAEEDPESFFAPEIVDAGLHESIWFDFRGFYRKQRKNPTVRDFDSERLRLVANLHGRAASDIEPLWARERLRAARTRYTIGVMTALVVVALGAAYYVQRIVANEERLRADLEGSLRHVAQAYQHLFSDPFNAAVEALRSTHRDVPATSAPATTAALEAAHRVLVERRKIALQERSITRTGVFSDVSQATTGPRFTRLSLDGERVLVVTEREGGLFRPEQKGLVYVLNNRTLEIVELTVDGESANYRLESADFVGADKVLVGRAFHAHLFTVAGRLLGSFQLQHTKTPVTAAGGMLDKVFFVAGNGAGCVWVEEYGKQGLVEPSEQLGAVTDCDDKDNPDAVVQILVDTTGRTALNLFQSGRLDLFALDGPEWQPVRRSVLETGGSAAAYRPGEVPSFAVAFADTRNGSVGLSRWDVISNEPRQVGVFDTPAGLHLIDYLGFSADGEYLVGLDNQNTLHIWDYKKREPVLTRTWAE